MATSRVDKYTTGTKAKYIYSDFLTNFNAHPNNGSLMTRTDINAVKRGIRNLLLTDRGERLYNPEYGCDIRSLLFEQPTPVIQQEMKNLIRNAIESFEKRVKLVEVVVTLSDNELTYTIDLYFNVINSSEIVEFQLKMDRVR